MSGSHNMQADAVSLALYFRASDLQGVTAEVYECAVLRFVVNTAIDKLCLFVWQVPTCHRPFLAPRSAR